jgi:hypothetical protein
MTLREVTEVTLVLGAALLLARDMRRAWLDQLRRPVTLLVAASVAALVWGAVGSSRPYPSPWWLVLPGSVLAWELARGWRRAPRCHLWEAGLGASGVGLGLAALGLGLGGGRAAAGLIAMAAAAAGTGAGLLWRSYRREPRPWRANDHDHYERRWAQDRRG